MTHKGLSLWVCLGCGKNYNQCVCPELEPVAHFVAAPYIPRLRFEDIYMDLAKGLARRSTCTRLQVGAVITSTDYRQVLSVGYNGGAAGVSNSIEANRCTGEPGACQCLHAEENAVINCSAPRAQEKYVFATHTPCRACAVRLINLGGVRRVTYATEYRETQPTEELFELAGIELVKYE